MNQYKQFLSTIFGTTKQFSLVSRCYDTKVNKRRQEVEVGSQVTVI